MRRDLNAADRAKGFALDRPGWRHFLAAPHRVGPNAAGGAALTPWKTGCSQQLTSYMMNAAVCGFKKSLPAYKWERMNPSGICFTEADEGDAAILADLQLDARARLADRPEAHVVMRRVGRHAAVNRCAQNLLPVVDQNTVVDHRNVCRLGELAVILASPYGN